MARPTTPFALNIWKQKNSGRSSGDVNMTPQSNINQTNQPRLKEQTMKKIKLNKMDNVDAKTQDKMREILAKRQNMPNANKQYDNLAGTAEVNKRNLIAHSDATEVFKKAHADYLAKRSVVNARALLKAATEEQEAARKSGATITRADRIEGAKQEAIATLDKEIGKSWRFSDQVNKALGVKGENQADVVVKSEAMPQSQVPAYAKYGTLETMGDGSQRIIWHRS